MNRNIRVIVQEQLHLEEERHQKKAIQRPRKKMNASNWPKNLFVDRQANDSSYTDCEKW